MGFQDQMADIEVVAQSLISLQRCQHEIAKRYSTALDSGAFAGIVAVASNEETSRFDYSRLYSLPEPLRCIEFATPRLLLVLPCDVDSWDDSDVTTLNFRLYFLCDCKYRKEYDLKSRSVI